MRITKTGYALNFIQSRVIGDESRHTKTHIYSFFSDQTKLKYILLVEEHDFDFYALKFYAKCHRKSDRKFNIIINKGDVFNILITCVKVIPILLEENPNASFGILGSRTITKENFVEPESNNKRFKIYSQLIPIVIGSNIFLHKEFPSLSGYLLLNKNHELNLNDLEIEIQKMITETYITLPLI